MLTFKGRIIKLALRAFQGENRAEKLRLRLRETLGKVENVTSA